MGKLNAVGRGRAASYLARVNLEIVKAAARRRQRQDQGTGARLPAALAGAPVTLEVITAGRDRITPLGHQTAKRALPPLLARLAANDPRRMVADMLADAVERVGAVRGADLAGADSKGIASDGGATTRVKHAARLRMIEALANRWPVDRRHGPRAGLPRVLMAPRRATEKRHKILAFPALVAVCVEGASVDAILRAHGWSAQAFNRGPLRDALLDALGDVAQGLGLSGASGQKQLDRS